MPIYEFACPACDALFEALKPIGETACSCPECSQTAEKVLSAFSARTISKSRPTSKKQIRAQKHNVKLPDDVKKPDFELGPPPALPDRYVHQLKHHGHC